MMRTWLSAIVACLALGALGGCVSLKRTPEARFFALGPVAEAPLLVAAESGTTIVGVLPVVLPAHLQRPQLVTWSGPGEVRMDEFLRWAEPLDSGIQRVLVEDLETLLPSHRVVPAPWPGSTPLRCRVKVELARFGPQTSGEVSLSGQFALLSPRSERALVIHAMDLRRGRASGPGDPGRTIEAMNALLADLAQQVADAIAALPQEPLEKLPSREAVEPLK
jgi:uncharacterized lipoprotein YmbA